MAQRDVELRLKARDDASKSVRKVSDALKAIAGDAENAAKGAGKTGTALGGLAADVARLQSEANKLKSFGNIAIQLDKSTAAVERSERALRGAQDEFARLATESRAATAAVAAFKAQTEGQAAALARTKDALAASRAEQTRMNAVVRQAEKDQLALNAARSQRTQGNRASAGVGIEAGAATSSAKASMGVFLDADLGDARARLTQVNTEVRNHAAAVQSSTAALKESKAETAAASREQKGLADQVERAGNALLRTRADAAANWRELERIDDAAAKASTSLGGLAARQDDIARAAQRSTDQLLRAQRALDAYGKFASGGGEVVNPKTAAALQSQLAVINELRADWKALEGETRTLAAALNSVSGNATAQVDAFKRMAAASREAKTEYLAQVGVLDAMRAKANLPASGLGKVQADAAGVSMASAGAATATSNLTSAQRDLAPATQRSSAAMRDAASSATQMGGAIRKSYSDKRQALSMTQRLRGEVLSLVTAYLGLRSAIGGIGQAVAAFRTLEGVQSRLGAVFAQDTVRVASEVDFLRGQADRLGISFATLGEQYGRFAIAAKAANFSAENTRKIFLSVAEAGRVNKLSLDQLNGTFLAIEQIISKGKFTSEEVRRQLGDRLPGAFNILADAMGMTTAELDKMMSKGDLLASESNLLKFADQMTRRFGPQLSASLDTVSTDIGRFENNLFKIRLALANGFIPQLREALQAFNNFANSEQGARAFAEIGSVVGRLIRILAEVPKYFSEIALAAKAFAAIMLAQAFTGVAARVLDLRKSFVSLGQSMAAIGPQMQQMSMTQRVIGQGFAQTIGAIDAYRARLLASTASTGVARVGTIAFAGSLGALRTAMMLTGNVAKLMWSAIGGLPGIVATGIVFAVGSWMTGINSATGALAEHDRQLAAVRETYQTVGETAKDWYKTVNGVTFTQAVRNTEEVREAYDKARRSLEKYSRRATAWTSDFEEDTPERKQAVALNTLSRQFVEGALSVKQYTDAIEAIARNPVNEDLKSVADGLLDILTASEDGAASVQDLETALQKSEAKLRVMTGKATQADEVLLGLASAVKETNTEFSNTSFVDTYTASIDTLKEAIPELAEEMKRLKEITDLNKAAWEGMTAAWNAGDYGKIGEIVGLWGRARGAIAEGERNAAVGGNLVDRIVGVESGGNANAKNPLSSATGAGQFIESTWLTMFKKYFPDRAASLSDAMILELRKNADLSRQMVELYAQENAAFLQRLGVKLNDGNLYLAHFLGPQGAADLLRAAPSTPVEQILGAGQINANRSILQGKTAGQVSTWAQNKMGGSDTEIAARQTLAEMEAEAAEARAEQAKATQDRIGQTNFEIGQQKLINDGKAKQAAIEEAVRAAKAENPNIGDAELATIRNQTAALYDQQHAREGVEAAEERVNHLYQLRQQLLEQQKMAEENGDFAQVENLKQQIAGLNGQTSLAIEQAIAMWTALGGPEADAAVAKLQTMSMTLKENSDRIIAFGLNASQISTVVGTFVDGMVGALDKMAEAIANGENAFKAMGTAFLQFAADFLRQIATMILKQMLLNALVAAFSGPIGQAARGMGGIAGHTGGLVGANAIGVGNRIGERPAWVQSAFTYHTGGLAGFAPDEVSATLRRNEEIVTEADPRHRFNLGGTRAAGGGERDRGIKQILVMNEDELANALASSAGERVIVTTLKRNASTIKQMLK